MNIDYKNKNDDLIISGVNEIVKILSINKNKINNEE